MLQHPSALYPGFLTPAFITCSANMEEGLVELLTCSDVLGHLEELLQGFVQLWDGFVDPGSVTETASF